MSRRELREHIFRMLFRKEFFASEEEFEAQTQAIRSYAQRHPLPVVTPEMIAQCCKATGIPVDVAYIQQFVMAGYRMTPVPKLL